MASKSNRYIRNGAYVAPTWQAEANIKDNHIY